MPSAAPSLPVFRSTSAAPNARCDQRSRQRSASSLSAEPGGLSAAAGRRSSGSSADASQLGKPSVPRRQPRRAAAGRRADGLALADEGRADVRAGRAASPARSVSEGDVPATDVDHGCRRRGAAVYAVGPAAADDISDNRTTTLSAEVIDLTDPDLTWTASPAATTGGQPSNETETGPGREVFVINDDSEADVIDVEEDDDVIFVSSNRRTPPRDVFSRIRFRSGSSLLSTDFFRIMMEAAIRGSERSFGSRTIAGEPAPGEIRLDHSLVGLDSRQLEFSLPDDMNDGPMLSHLPPKPVPAYVRRLEPLGYTRNSTLEMYVDIAEGEESNEQGSEPVVARPAGGSVASSLTSESSPPTNSSRPSTTYSKGKRRRADEADVGQDGALSAVAAEKGGPAQSDVLPAKKRLKIVVPGRIKCPICLRMPEAGWHTTRCGHVFCDECISNVKSAKKCAACQRIVKPKHVRKLFL